MAALDEIPELGQQDPARAVLNQAPPLEPANLFELDLVLQEALVREGGGWGIERARESAPTHAPIFRVARHTA